MKEPTGPQNPAPKRFPMYAIEFKKTWHPVWYIQEVFQTLKEARKFTLKRLGPYIFRITKISKKVVK